MKSSNQSRTKLSADKISDDMQEFAYALSHDMGAPLRAVVQFSKLLSQRLNNKLKNDELLWLGMVEKNGVHAQKMLEALLKYSRLTTHAEQHCEFSLTTMINETISQVAKKEDTHHVKISVIGELPVISGCKEQWQFMLEQLIDNAIKYQLPDNDYSPKIIIENLSKNNEPFNISISDNGMGVDENKLPHLAIPFKRFHDSRIFPGLGMGLTYCKKICELHSKILGFELSSYGGLKVTISDAIE